LFAVYIIFVGKMVAIKVLEVDHEDAMELQKEINILKDCDDKHIVAYKGSFEKDNHVWVIIFFKYIFF